MTYLPLQVASFYAWPNIAERTEVVYDISRNVRQDGSLLARLRRYYTCGSWFGKVCCCLAIIEFLWWQLVQQLYPQCSTDIAPDWPLGKEPTAVAQQTPQTQAPLPSHVESKPSYRTSIKLLADSQTQHCG